MLFTYIFLAIGGALLVLFLVLWFVESEEEHDDEVTLREHLVEERESIELEAYRVKEAEGEKKEKKS